MFNKGGNFLSPDKQKRESARIRVQLKGQYRFVGYKDWMECSIYDVGIGGIRLEGKTSFYIGDELDVGFMLDNITIKASLIVTNIAGKKAGSRFIDIDKDSKDAIQKFLHNTLLVD